MLYASAVLMPTIRAVGKAACKVEFQKRTYSKSLDLPLFGPAGGYVRCGHRLRGLVGCGTEYESAAGGAAWVPYASPGTWASRVRHRWPVRAAISAGLWTDTADDGAAPLILRQRHGWWRVGLAQPLSFCKGMDTAGRKRPKSFARMGMGLDNS